MENHTYWCTGCETWVTIEVGKGVKEIVCPCPNCAKELRLELIKATIKI